MLDAGREPDPLVAVVDVPMTLSGLSHVNVENALAAIGCRARRGPAAGRRGGRAAHVRRPALTTTRAG